MRLLRVAFLPLSIAILIWAGLAVPLPQYVQQPGSVVALGRAVVIDGAGVGELHGEFHLTTVNLRRASTFDYVWAGLSPNVDTTPAANVIPEGVDPKEYFDRQQQVFRDAGRLAAAIGLCAAEFYDEPCQLTGDGALIVEVVAGSAAEGVLVPGDVVVRAGGRPVVSDADLRDAVSVAMILPDRPLELAVVREDHDQELLLEVLPRPVPNVSDEPILGVGPATLNPRIDRPVPVEITSGRIGGPSAGLMIALTVYDKVDQEIDLARGRTIAGTGTIDVRGAVGPIGGVRFKVVAAHRARADIFLVPAGQLDVARAALPAGSDLVILPVETFDDALEWLQRMIPLDQAQ